MANRALSYLICMALLVCAALHGVAFVSAMLLGGICGAMLVYGIVMAAEQDDRHRA